MFKKIKKLFAVEKKNDNSFLEEKNQIVPEEVEKQVIVTTSDEEESKIDSTLELNKENTLSEDLNEKPIVKRSDEEQRRIDLILLAHKKYANISLIDSLEEREFDVPYRKDYEYDDYDGYDEDVIKFIRKQPKGTPKKIFSLCNIAGVSYRQEDALKAVIGENLSLRAEKEPTNSYDPNAIKIMADYEENGEKNSVKIGYIPRGKAKKLAKFDRINITLREIRLPEMGIRNISFKIDIWVESQKQKTQKKLFKEHSYDPNIEMPDNFADRNGKAKELEEKGYLDNAIEMYLKNTFEEDTTLYPFKRLAIIYRKRKDFANEILIINRALDMLKKRNCERDEKQKEEMELRLKRVRELKEKEENKK